MQHIPDILKAMAEYGISPVMLLFMGMIYMMGVQNGTFPKFWGSKENKEMVPTWAQHLLDHFNDDITTYHVDSKDKLDVLIDNDKLTHDYLKNITNTINNYDKYGIKFRKE